MNQRRVKEILDSSEIIQVAFQNIPVWIDRLTSPETVEIQDMNSNISMEVKVEELHEMIEQ